MNRTLALLALVAAVALAVYGVSKPGVAGGGSKWPRATGVAKGL